MSATRSARRLRYGGKPRFPSVSLPSFIPTRRYIERCLFFVSQRTWPYACTGKRRRGEPRFVSGALKIRRTCSALIALVQAAA
jgi:hypothetical protein